MNDAFLMILVHNKSVEILRIDVQLDQLLFDLVSFLRRGRAKDVVSELLVILGRADVANLLLDLLHYFGFALIILFIRALIMHMNMAFKLADNF